MMIAGRAGRLAGIEVDARRPAQGADDRFQQRGLDALPAASAMTRFECEQDTLRRIDATQQIADGDADAGGATRGGAGHTHQAGEALRNLVEARVVAHRTGRAEARNAACDDARVARRNLFVAEADRFHHARPEVVDDNVGAVDQPLQDGATLGRLGRDLDTLLRAIGAEEEVGVFAALVPHLAARAFDRFDLENFGAVVAQYLGAERPGKVAREVNDFDPGERRTFGHGWLLLNFG